MCLFVVPVVFCVNKKKNPKIICAIIIIFSSSIHIELSCGIFLSNENPYHKIFELSKILITDTF